MFAAELFVGPSRQSLVLTEHASSLSALVCYWFAGQRVQPSWPPFWLRVVTAWGWDLTAHMPCPRLDSSVQTLPDIWPSKQGTR